MNVIDHKGLMRDDHERNMPQSVGPYLLRFVLIVLLPLLLGFLVYWLNERERRMDQLEERVQQLENKAR